MIDVKDIEVFCEGIDHGECVAVHPDGSVWCGGEAGQIYRISKDGKQVEEVARTGGFILGIAFSLKAEWMAICDMKHKYVWKMDMKTYQLKIFADGAEGRRFMLPNYAVFDNSGNLYVSDSGIYQQHNGIIYKFNKDGAGMVWHKGPFHFANGLALHTSEQHLYIACTCSSTIERIVINADGAAGAREVIAAMPKTLPDGLAFDAQGNLYLSCYTPGTIYKIDEQFNVEVLVHDWENVTIAAATNIAFGGHNFDQLFTTNLKPLAH